MKVSGELLAGGERFGVSLPAVDRLTEEIKAVNGTGA
ncbi:MAG: UMP kinase, partial [Gemmatimonadetes bacterium]|nr:UMP kinase [Gemmatimonadota bacterium]